MSDFSTKILGDPSFRMGSDLPTQAFTPTTWLSHPGFHEYKSSIICTKLGYKGGSHLDISNMPGGLFRRTKLYAIPRGDIKNLCNKDITLLCRKFFLNVN